MKPRSLYVWILHWGNLPLPKHPGHLATSGDIFGCHGWGRGRLEVLPTSRSFPGVSDSKGSAHNAGNLGSIPGFGKFPWRRKWQSTPVFFPGESHGQRSLMGYSPWDHKESDTTERLILHFTNIYLLDAKDATKYSTMQNKEFSSTKCQYC